MQLFLRILFLFILPLALSLAITVYFFNPNNHFSYSKFEHKTSSLILGSSKAAFGINPASFKNQPNMLNFAFFEFVSPYGDTYLEAIKQKVEDESRNGLFIIEVSPYSISLNKKDIRKYPEQDELLGKQISFNSSPNIEYIFRECSPYFQNFISKDNATPTNKGWVGFDRKDESQYELFISNQIKKMKEQNDLLYYSNYRISKLKETISFLKKHGKVHLVKMPIADTLYNLEKLYWKDFDSTIINIAATTQSNYINLQTVFPNLKGSDGIHLEINESLDVSEWLSKHCN